MAGLADSTEIFAYFLINKIIMLYEFKIKGEKICSYPMIARN